MTTSNSPRNSVIRRPSRLAPDGLERLRAAAAARGGQLLTDRYLGVSERYRFRCQQGHKWDAIGYAVLRGDWCPQCGHEKTGRARRDPEGLARLQAAAAAKGGICLSQTYTSQSARYRFRCAQGHEWATVGSKVFVGNWCPLCGNEKIGAALRDRQGLARLQAAAAAKGGECLSQTYTNQSAHYRFRCAQGHEWEATAGSVLRGGHWCRWCRSEKIGLALRDRQGLARLHAAAAAKGGECLSQTYTTQSAHYRFRCAQGHEWETIGRLVLDGNWCQRCSSQRRADKKKEGPDLARVDPEGLARLHAAAAAKGGVCLSQTYMGQSMRYRFRCAQGHEWEAVGTTVLQGGWCRPCSYEKRSLNSRDPEGLARLQAAAVAKGGVCLSEVYTNQRARYRFRCALGHEWETMGNCVVSGSWCIFCADAAHRLDITHFQAIAAERGGECLSPVYRDRFTKLTWMCHKGHVWQALGNKIKQGTWCPECAHANRITRADSKARRRYRAVPFQDP